MIDVEFPADATRLQPTDIDATTELVASHGGALRKVAGASLVDPRVRTLASPARKRIRMISGGEFDGGSGSTTGAFKIKLPVGIDARNMVLSLSLMDQYGSLHFTISGVNNSTQWDYVKAIVAGDHQFLPQPNIRLGHDSTGPCLWIGDTTINFWAYPKVWIDDVRFGGSTITEDWLADWAISLVTSYDTVTNGPLVPRVPMPVEFKIDTTKYGMSLGIGASMGTGASSYNFMVGHGAGAALTSGYNNVGLGLQVLNEATTAQACTGVGTQAIQHITTAQQACAFGIHALLSLTTGYGNVAMGAGATEYLTTGEYNTAIGTYAGRDVTGSRNVFLGNRAGMTLTSVNDQLRIANNETEALIEGDFAARTLKLNGDFKAEKLALAALNTAPSSSSATGTAGQIRIDASFVYVCTATNTWKRAALSTW